MLPSSGDKDMSAERFDRIDQKIAGIEGRFDALGQRVDAMGGALNERIEGVNTQLTARMDAMGGALSQRIDTLGSDLNQRIDTMGADLSQRMDTMGADLNQRMDTMGADLNQRMGVLHENVLEIIASSSERNAVTRGEFQEAMADLKETISRRIDPLEVVVRRHSADIAKLKRAR